MQLDEDLLKLNEDLLKWFSRVSLLLTLGID